MSLESCLRDSFARAMDRAKEKLDQPVRVADLGSVHWFVQLGSSGYWSLIQEKPGTRGSGPVHGKTPEERAAWCANEAMAVFRERLHVLVGFGLRAGASEDDVLQAVLDVLLTKAVHGS